jgi:putative Mg2+ transporter-C (MgtC) family protein
MPPNSYLPFYWIELAQLVAAAVCGVIIGYEREQHQKPAGVTTMVIVTMASTLVMQLGFRLAVLGGGVTPADPARLASAVVSGIGFLGAGMIIRNARAIHGINTAATIWSMACIGLALGAGAYVPAGMLTLLVRIALHFERLRLTKLAERRRAAGLPPEPPDDGY